MKHRQGCDACRGRHRKCVFPAVGNICYSCQESGRTCLAPPKFIFVSPGQSSPPPTASASSPLSEQSSVQNEQDEQDVAPLSPPRSPSQPLVSLKAREGQLFSLYVRQLAPMMDSCDEARHFTLAIPRLALHEPMLLSSILALAGRYDALHRHAPPDIDAVRYSNHCIESLIGSLARPPSTYGPELLAAVVIARSYEECDFEDDCSHYHLSGISDLLSYSTVVRLASKGGLAEAACWVHLRQAIYAYLVRRRPVDRHLDAFEHLSAFSRTDDAAYANRMVYHFARILRLFFPSADTSTLAQPRVTWESVQADMADWFKRKPTSFEPICYGESAGVDGEQFPNIVMLGAAPVMGLQYYHAAVLVLHMKESNEANSNAGFQAVKARKQHEHSIVANLFTLMGLAMSNEYVLDSFLLPTHLLSLCGYCIREPQQRQTALYFLHRVNALVAWTTQPLMSSLSEQWAECDRD